MPTQIISFGHKYGILANGWVIDIRSDFHTNPFREQNLRELTGLDKSCQDYMKTDPNFWAKYADLRNRIENYNGIVYIGCAGGRHRSVYLAELLSKDLDCPVYHRDINK